ncbi:MAG: acetyl-CoA carboxylase carboxyltransferase subunit alpha [Bacilli bacterium]|jgi:acetyl-CoA carboxylase carboxyl transferase subunit alpha|nr:acetyl-CoA carboxylase carboxyltransferase subunit alpha [Acholeplasmataceae bacterium]
MEKKLEDIVWEKVQLARHNKRPTARTLINYLFSEFTELHGDRLYADDRSILAGIAFLEATPVTVIAQEKGVSTKEKIEHNFGMPHPEGYRKALRLMKQAEKFKRPIILIIDTPGAYPGVGAEERGQASAIAVNLAEMAGLRVPMLAIVLGEGGSGGALAIGVADETWMFENAIYAILSPEGFASILYKDVFLAKYAASVMKLTADDLHSFGIVDLIVPEVEGGLHLNAEYSFSFLKERLIEKVAELKAADMDELLAKRYLKFRKMGAYEEKSR